MKISFFSESQIRGKIPRDFSNARTEYAWMMALDAEHHPLGTNPSKRFDLGIVIVPKTNPNVDLDFIRGFCDKVFNFQNLLCFIQTFSSHNTVAKNIGSDDHCSSFFRYRSCFLD